MNNFSEVIGNEHIVQSIESAVRNHKVSHAYIITGEKGSGKKLIAGAFAKTLLCDREGERACDSCVSCRTFDGGNNPDVAYVYPTKTKALSVDDVRNQITSNVNIKPYNHKYKIYIIPNADTLTIQAQNALLKTLEEPPEYAVFMLLAENTDSFLQTIMSRCVLFTVKPIATYMVTDYLINNLDISAEKAIVCAECSQGSIGKAVDFANSEDFGTLRKTVVDALRNIKTKEYYKLTDAAKELEAFKDMADVTDMVYMWFRDVLAYKITGDRDSVIEKDLISDIINEAKENSYESLCKIPECITKAKRQIRQNVNFGFAMEMLFINIKGELTYDRGSRS